jgi:OOP family OmpA-OmpF porin
LGVLTAPLFRNGLMLRMEVRYVYDTREGGISEPRLSAGIQIPLGRVERVIEYKEVKTVEVREVVRDAPPPAAAAVVDSDGDGVDDAHDECPGTPRGVRVDPQGCAIADQVVTLEDVNFDTNRAVLTSLATARLAALAAAFRGQPALEVEIAGHTDTVGSPTHNLALSQRRAEAVRTFLIASGISPSRLTARGYGITRLLISPETTDEDRARNRRVELHIVRSR